MVVWMIALKFFSIHLYINTSLYRNWTGSKKCVLPNQKFWKYRVNTCESCPFVIPLPSFLQIQSNNSLGSYFFSIVVLNFLPSCCIILWLLIKNHWPFNKQKSAQLKMLIPILIRSDFNWNFNCSIVWWVWLVTCQTMIE